MVVLVERIWVKFVGQGQRSVQGRRRNMFLFRLNMKLIFRNPATRLPNVKEKQTWI